MSLTLQQRKKLKEVNKILVEKNNEKQTQSLTIGNLFITTLKKIKIKMS